MSGTSSPPGATPKAPNPENVNRAIRIVKVVVNSGVGQSGEPRQKAERVLQMITHQKPIATRSHSTNRDFGIRAGQEIGAKVTLRGASAVDFLNRAFEARDRQLDPDSIDRNGNFSFGIADYTDFTGMKYDPEIGIHGMDIAVELGRAGYGVRERQVGARPIPKRLRSTKTDTRAYLAATFQVTFVE